ncbi:Mechanosensitive ion channel family protein, partial [Zostera marina]
MDLDSPRPGGPVKHGEVVVQVSGDDLKDDGLLTSNSNEPPISNCLLSASNRLPPKPPHHDSPLSSPTATRRRTSFAKRKSRFDDQHIPYPHDSKAEKNSSRSRSESPSATDTPMRNGTPKTPGSLYDEEDEEEMEVYQLEEKKRRSRKFKIRVLIEWMILVISCGCLVMSLTVSKLDGFVIWGLEIWKWCVMAVVVFCARLLTSWFVSFLVFLIEKNFLFKKKVLYFVYGLKGSFQVCIWFGLMLLGWVLLFNRVERSKQTSKILNKVTRLLISLLVGSVIWLVKTLLVKLLASSFHVNRFFERIQESVFNQYVLQTLLGPPVMELGKNMVEFAKKGKQISFKKKRSKRCGGREEQEGKIDIGKLNQMRREKVNAWTMKGLMSVISSGFLTISNVIDDDRKDEEITNEVEAKGVGYRIFKNVAKPQSRYIEEEDLLRFLSRQEVDMVFPLFEGASETGKIRKKSLKKWVVNAYVERKSLAHSLDDTKTAVKQVHRLAS